MVAGQDAALDDAADAGDVGHLRPGIRHEHVAGGGPDDLHERARLDARADGAVMGVEGADGHGDVAREARFLRHLGDEEAGDLVGGLDLPGTVEAVAEVGERGIELPEEGLRGEAAPFLGVHRLVARGADAPGDCGGIGVPCEHGGHPVGELHPVRRRFEHGPVDPQAVPYLGPEPLRGVGPPAFGQVMGALLRRRGGDGLSLVDGGVVLPEPRHGVRVALELIPEAQRPARRVHGNGGRSRRVNTDTDDVHGSEALDVSRLGEGAENGALQSRQVVCGVLAREMRRGRV